METSKYLTPDFLDTHDGDHVVLYTHQKITFLFCFLFQWIDNGFQTT
jgi:hypothetical protein